MGVIQGDTRSLNYSLFEGVYVHCFSPVCKGQVSQQTTSQNPLSCGKLLKCCCV